MFCKIVIAVCTLFLISLMGRFCFKTLLELRDTREWEIGDQFIYTHLNDEVETFEIIALDYDKKVVFFKNEENKLFKLSFLEFKNNNRIRRK